VRPAPVTTRVARPADAATMARTMHTGIETYRAFAPTGWEPHAPPQFVERMTETLRDRHAWALLADVAGEPAAHVAMFPDWQPGGAIYLWHLFVRPAWWGSGLAGALHDAFIAEAGERGYRDARLHTPAANARARRFYERRGWRVSAPPETWIGLPVIEYRCRLRP
jgi:GNAT superfamily N-acetyltransferase